MLGDHKPRSYIYTINKKIKVMIQLSDLREFDGLYYVGDIADVDGSPWVDLETAELILTEVNGSIES